MDDETAQARVLEAADQLFYAHGIRSVGIDQIRDASGVSLKRLYRLFGAKEDIAAAALRRRNQAFTEALKASVAGYAGPREQLLGVFDFLYEWFDEPDFRGCPFINAFAEADNAGAVTCVVEEQKHGFASLLKALVADAGAPPELAEQLFILAHGAMVAAAIQRSPAAAREAQRAAEVLITAQI
jgi:AcrR family transcriptional regulator